MLRSALLEEDVEYMLGEPKDPVNDVEDEKEAGKCVEEKRVDFDDELGLVY